MKITRNVPKPQPVTVTLEITLDELIALKTFAEFYGARSLSTRTAAAERFANSIPEGSYSWKNTDALFR